MTKNEALKKIKELKEFIENSGSGSIELEDHNFRINSSKWKKITVDKKVYLENKKKDIWEITFGKCKGEQLFTWGAAMRETAKVGKRMPTDEEFTEILKDKSTIINPVFSGFRYTGGSFYNLGSLEYSWSSSVSGGSAWVRLLYVGEARVNRRASVQAVGFSVRCVKE